MRARERYSCFDHVVTIRSTTACRRTSASVRTCENEVVAQLVEMQRRKIARSGRSPGRRRLVPRRPAGSCRAQRRGLLPRDVRRPRARRGTCATRTWPTRSTCSPSTSATATPAQARHLGAQLARRRRARDRARRRRRDHARPAPAAAPPRRDRASSASPRTTAPSSPHTTGMSPASASACDRRCRAAGRSCSTPPELPRFYATSAQLRARGRRAGRPAAAGDRRRLSAGDRAAQPLLACAPRRRVRRDHPRRRHPRLEPLDDVDLPDDEAAHAAHELPETYPSGI